MNARSAKQVTFKKAGAEVSEHRLQNGLRVLLIERHLDPVVAAMIWYKVGSKNEREEEAGVSHFLEHMMFKGTRRYGKGVVDRLTTELGGSNNAFTNLDHTGYWFELASDRWERALELEADRMRGLTLDPVEFEAEKAVVLEELSMGLDDPWRRLSHGMHESLFARHPYRRPVIGYVDTLQRMQPGDMRAYYKRFYHPGNATIVICGDFRKRAALASIRKHFGQIAAGPPVAEVDCFRPAIAEPLGEQRLVTYWDDSATRIMMAWPTVPVGSPEDDQLDVISTVLSGGRLSRLHRRLVLEQGLATSIATNNGTLVEGGAFWLYAECAEGVAAAVLEAAIDAELERLARELVPAAELTRAKRTLAATEAYEGETVTDLAENIGEYATDADWRLALDGPERIAKVRAADVRKSAARFLTRARRVVGWSLPEDEREHVRG